MRLASTGTPQPVLQHLERGLPFQQPVRQFLPGHPGHHDVGHEDVRGPGLEERERVQRAIAAFQRWMP